MQKYALMFRICNNDQKPSKYAYALSKNPGPTHYNSAMAKISHVVETSLKSICTFKSHS
ncbi:hypothetical protein B7P43_G15074 [Cryptotermes secundus]|uniref:Uncharacterized protein n=1 Tax=Cryptotermes secundus TaxID=105785 RepID=A0A2J7Q425_9NEOP|nr:hypothetical protein B7P43_G15074 [Cryptotermes secundus]